MAERIATIEAEIVAMRKDVDEKHRQNRTSIHDLRNGQQQTDDKLGTIHDMVQQLIGMGKLGGALGAFVAVVWTILQIKIALHR